MTGSLFSMQKKTLGPTAAALRRRRLGVALLVAAAVHALLFAGLGRSARAPKMQPVQVPAALWVHDIEPAPHATEEPPRLPVRTEPRSAAAPQRAARSAGLHPAARVEPPAPAGATPVIAAVVAPAIAPVAAPPRIERAEPAPAQSRDTAAVVENDARPRASAAEVAHEPASATEAAHDSVPVYATRVPAPAVLQYRMRRGIVHGNAELIWRVDAGRYEARLEARASGITVLTQVSQGALGAAGLAPQRFTDKRLRRSAVAANFGREPGPNEGKISFSAGETQVPLHPATQDRLSWLVQLAAIAGAEPKLLAAHGRVALHVVGARGDAAVWQFVSLGEEVVDESPGAMHVFRLQRLAESTYDTQVDVWLDAKPPHWPVRAHWRNGTQDPGMEMWRIDIAEPR